jgi:hypothetical protein
MSGLLSYPDGNTNIASLLLWEFKYCSHNAPSSPRHTKYWPNYSPITNCTPHTHILVMIRGVMYNVGIFSVPMTGVLGIHISTKMKLSFVAQEKKCWTNRYAGKKF